MLVALDSVEQLMFLAISLFVLMTELWELNDEQYKVPLLLFEAETGLKLLEFSNTNHGLKVPREGPVLNYAFRS